MLAGQVNQRRYEALRAYLSRGPLLQAAGRAGYTRARWVSLVRDFRAGQAAPVRPARQARPQDRPGARTPPAPGSSNCAATGLSVYEIAPAGRGGHPAGPHRRRRDPRRGRLRRLLRGPAPDASTARPPPAATPGARAPPSRLRRPARPGRNPPGRAAAGHPGPGCPGPARPGRRGRLPRHPAIPAVPLLLSLLALKLTGTRRVSHVDDLLTDPAAPCSPG